MNAWTYCDSILNFSGIFFLISASRESHTSGSDSPRNLSSLMS